MNAHDKIVVIQVNGESECSLKKSIPANEFKKFVIENSVNVRFAIVVCILD